MEQKTTDVYKSSNSSYMSSFVEMKRAMHQNMLVADR